MIVINFLFLLAFVKLDDEGNKTEDAVEDEKVNWMRVIIFLLRK